MSSNDTLQDTLRQASGFLNDIWNKDDNLVPVDNLNRDYITQSVRMARSMVETAQRLAERVPPAEKKSVVLEFRKAHKIGTGGQFDPETQIPDRYTVRSITGSMAWLPGDTLEEAQVALLLEDPAWTFTVR